MLSLPVISLDIVKATKIITFNAAAELNLGPATLVIASSGTVLAPIERKFDATTQRVSLTFAEELPAAIKATLRIGFEADLTDSMTGYYKSTWKGGIYALTQFEVRGRHVHTVLDEHLLSVSNIEAASELKQETRCCGSHVAPGLMISMISVWLHSI